MALPSYEHLVKWTLYDILSWLEQEGLSEFRDQFRDDGIDGSKFCKLQEADVDRFYCSSKKKKQLLKNHIACIDRSKAPSLPKVSEMWKNQQKNSKVPEPEKPALPSRRAPPPPPDEPAEDNDDVYDWGDDFEQSGTSDLETDEGSDYENSQEAVNGSAHPNLHDNVPEEDYMDPCPQTNPETPETTNMIASLRSALQRHRESKKYQPDSPTNAEGDEEDYVEPVTEPLMPPPPRPGPRTVPKVEDRNAPQQQAPPIPSPRPAAKQQPPLPPPPRKASVSLCPPPEDVYDKPDEVSAKGRQLPPVPTPGHRSSKTTLGAKKSTDSESEPPIPLAPRKHSSGKTEKKLQVPSPRKMSSASNVKAKQKNTIEDSKDDYIDMNGGVNTSRTFEPPDEMSTYPWYHSDINRTEAENQLKAQNQNGMFLVRKSTRSGTDQKYTLMIYNQQKVYNLPVRCLQNKKYILGNHREDEITFTSVAELISYFKNQIIQLNPNDRTRTGRTKLTEPLKKV